MSLCLSKRSLRQAPSVKGFAGRFYPANQVFAGRFYPEFLESTWKMVTIISEHSLYHAMKEAWMPVA
jgi:hypothetical protein